MEVDMVVGGRAAYLNYVMMIITGICMSMII